MHSGHVLSHAVLWKILTSYWCVLYTVVYCGRAIECRTSNWFHFHLVHRRQSEQVIKALSTLATIVAIVAEIGDYKRKLRYFDLLWICYTDHKS